MNRFYYLTLIVFLLSINTANAKPALKQKTIELNQSSFSTSLNWSGFYAGINSGFFWGEAHAKTTGATPTESGYFTPADALSVNENGNFRSHPIGYTGGVQIGYNKCFLKGITLGIETDFGAFLLSKSQSVSAIYPTVGTGEYTLYQKVSTDWLYTLRPRIGYAYKKVFIFLTGGLSLTNLKYHQVFSDNSLSTQGYSTDLDAYTAVSKSKASAGWTVGAGMEYLLYKRLSICLSYLYTNFSSLSCSDHIRLNLLDTLYTSSLSSSANLEANVLRVGLNWRI